MLLYPSDEEEDFQIEYAYGKREQNATAFASFEDGGVFIYPSADSRLSSLAMKSLKSQLSLFTEAILSNEFLLEVYEYLNIPLISA